MSTSTSSPQAQRTRTAGDGKTTVYVRKNIWKLTNDDHPWDPVTVAYAKAVAAMQARTPTDRTSWIFQANIHGTYDKPVPVPPLWNQCPHRNWFFLPWHRLYLYHFEQIVRAIVRVQSPELADSFAVPYWDYDNREDGWNVLPPPFRQKSLPDGAENPLYLEGPLRDAAVVAGASLSKKVTDSVECLKPTNFTGGMVNFGGGPPGGDGSQGALEQTPHNAMHVTIGGRMSEEGCGQHLMAQVPCAARDPIFWLHHGNIDRLWNKWLARGGGRGNPEDGAWLDQEYTFVGADGKDSKMKVRDCLDGQMQLHYRYDTESPARMVPAQPRSVFSMADNPSDGSDEGEVPPAELTAASAQPVTLRDRSASVTLTTPDSTRDALAAAAPADSPRSIYLTVEDLEAERNPGIVYGVYLDVPGQGEPRRHHVGNVTAFGMETAKDPDIPHDAMGGFRHTFDITDLVGDLSATGDWDPDAVTVTFEPIEPPGSAALAAQAEEESDEAAAGPEVRVGRVGLFVS